ncbi:MAG: hypothetical protein KGI45_01560 [Patescibacteria group bacterium]|nr:hypothetical protein [Patescibacteria group bacterium]MDE1940834.1 hypothetical protein [Patescibacteria group bacterium]MDE1966744.1 hypothetical protein [Patescibacteria group bacterium]
MATTKQRIAVTLDKNMGKALRLRAKRDQVPVASAASDLLRMALEIDEDLHFGKIAEARMKMKDIKWIPHDEFWEKALGKK